MRNLTLYMKFIRVAFLAKLQYKSDFFVGLVSIFVLNGVNLSLLGILVYNFHTLGNWDIWELLFLYSFWMISRGIYGVFFWHIAELEDLIIDGTFDAYLVRPISPFLQFMGKDISYTGIGDFLVGIIGIILASYKTVLQWNVGKVFLFFVCILSGVLIQLTINLICASLSFWITRSRVAISIAERFTVLMQQYPVSIFGKGFQLFVTCVLPVAFINYYPCLIILNKGGSSIWYFFSPLVAIVLSIISAGIWTRGIKKYSSTGN